MRTWTFEQEELLKEKYPTATNAELAGLFPDKTIQAIKTKALKLGAKKAKKRFHFTPEQLDELKRDFATTLNIDLANRFGCSIHTVENAGFRYRLKKDSEFLRNVFRKNMLDPNHPGRKFLIKKGNIPMNKGKKQSEYMSPEMIERTKATRFKKGDLPRNTLYDGAITIRKHKKTGIPYKYIRIGLAKWVSYHRYLWEQAYGKIPKGTNIQFKDGNTLNCVLENLYAVTRNNQMLDNSGSINLTDNMVAVFLAGKRGKDKRMIEEFKKHPRLLDLKRKQLILNRKIKNKMEATLKKLENMIGNTYKYEGRKVTVNDVKINGSIATLKTNGEDIQITIDDFFDNDLEEFHLIKENGLMKHPTIVDAVLQNGTMYEKLQSTLLETIDKLQTDKEYIPQAEAINNTLKSIIDLEKVRVSTFALLK